MPPFMGISFLAARMSSMCSIKKSHIMMVAGQAEGYFILDFLEGFDEADWSSGSRLRTGGSSYFVIFQAKESYWESTPRRLRVIPIRQLTKSPLPDGQLRTAHPAIRRGRPTGRATLALQEACGGHRTETDVGENGRPAPVCRYRCQQDRQVIGEEPPSKARQPRRPD